MASNGNSQPQQARKKPHRKKPPGKKEIGNYSREDLTAAVQGVINKKLSTHQASKKYGPAIRTINRHVR